MHGFDYARVFKVYALVCSRALRAQTLAVQTNAYTKSTKCPRAIESILLEECIHPSSAGDMFLTRQGSFGNMDYIAF